MIDDYRCIVVILDICRSGTIHRLPIILRESVSVKDFGAQGDGITDDTQRINAAIDFVHGMGGGTIVVPQGTYMIDSVKANNTVAGGVVLKSNIQLVFDQSASFQAIPNASRYYAILSIHDCENVRIKGARLVGERDGHLDTAGEWGHGISMFNCSKAIVVDTLIRDCWGDGIYISAANEVTLMNCVSDHNRRQVMSIIVERLSVAKSSLSGRGVLMMSNVKFANIHDVSFLNRRI